MRVLFFSSRDLTVAGGTSVRVLNLAKYVRRHVDALDLMATAVPATFDPSVSRLALASGRPFGMISTAFPTLERAVRLLPGERLLGKTLRSHRWDLVHVHQHASGFRLLRHRRATAAPIVFDVHGILRLQQDDLSLTRSFFERKLQLMAEANLFGAVDGITVRSEEERALIATTFEVTASKIYVVPDGIDIEYFSQPVPQADVDTLRTRLGVGNSKVILFVGWFKRLGGIMELLRAFEIVEREHEDVMLVMAGDGPLADEARRFVAEKKLRRVRFPGLITRGDLRVYQEMATAVVSPETSGTFNDLAPPIKVLECLASGKALVAGRLKCNEQLIEHERSGMLVDPADQVSFANAFRVLLANPERAAEMGALGRLIVEKGWTWNRSAQAALAAYSDVLSKTVNTSRRPVGASVATRAQDTPGA